MRAHREVGGSRPRRIGAASLRGAQGNADERLLFVDFSSLPQKPRTAEEAATFSQALDAMGLLYASPFTAVIQVKSMPEDCPEWLVGNLIVLKASREEVTSSAIVHCDGFVTCEGMEDGNVRVRFDSHANAVAALAIKDTLPFIAVFEEWNSRPYDERGWCRFEEGVALLVAAHMRRLRGQDGEGGGGEGTGGGGGDGGGSVGGQGGRGGDRVRVQTPQKRSTAPLLPSFQPASFVSPGQR